MLARTLQRLALPVLIVISLVGCVSAPVNEISLMPAPAVFADGLLNPLPESSPYNEIPYHGILYATDRTPATSEHAENFYLNERGQILRLGVAKVSLGDGSMTWEQKRQESMLTKRARKIPIKILQADEWGVLQSTIPFWENTESLNTSNSLHDATDKFAGAINEQLARSQKKDVYIYVHGYKVTFENPVLVTAELWHFLGYRGAFIAYAWPSTPSRFAYIKDQDTAEGFARNFRLLLEFVAEKTNAEQIHVIGYSTGTRLVTRAMEQLALMNHDQSSEELFEKLRIRNVILVGSDLDRGVFRSYVADDLLNVSKHLTIYLSDTDKALGISQFLTRRERIGQMLKETDGEQSPALRKALISYLEQISLINVTAAEGASEGNGHGYFLHSPWASSDVLATLYFGLTPEQRGLVEQDDLPVYSFPPDYISRLWGAIEKVDPVFAENYKTFLSDQNTSVTPVNDER